MDQLSDEQQQMVRKMSTERIQGRLMRADLDEELVYSLGRRVNGRAVQNDVVG